MTTSFTPSFTSINKINVPFVTNNPTMADRASQPTVIVALKFNEVTRSIEATCSDRRLRQVRIDRLDSDRAIELLTKALQVAMDTKQEVQFIAAGGADPAVWFYNIK
jgi:hypothetical protein